MGLFRRRRGKTIKWTTRELADGTEIIECLSLPTSEELEMIKEVIAGRKVMAKKGQKQRSGQVLLTEIERMALEQLESVRREIDLAQARHRVASRRFIQAFAKAHATPEAIRITTNGEGTMATWEEQATKEAEEALIDAEKEADGA